MPLRFRALQKNWSKIPSVMNPKFVVWQPQIL